MKKSELKEILNNHPLIQWTDENPDEFYFNGAYHCRAGEYARPHYQIVRYKDGFGIKGFYYYYGNDEIRRLDPQELDWILRECEFNRNKRK